PVTDHGLTDLRGVGQRAHRRAVPGRPVELHVELDGAGPPATHRRHPAVTPRDHLPHATRPGPRRPARRPERPRRPAGAATAVNVGGVATRVDPAERLLDLLIALRHTQGRLTKAAIRASVNGYRDAANDVAFER